MKEGFSSPGGHDIMGVYAERKEQGMPILKEWFTEAGLGTEVHNVIADFRTPDGKSAHRAYQIISSGAPCTDEVMLEHIKAQLPQNCRLCSIYEVMANCKVSELEKLSMSFDVFNYKLRFFYVDKELAMEYIKEIQNGNLG